MEDPAAEAAVEGAQEEVAAPRREITPADFPPPMIELTYPAAVIQFEEGQGPQGPIVVMHVVAPDEDGKVRTRHYPMGLQFAQSLEEQLHKARGSKIEIARADQLPPDAKAA